ncbi:MAG: hypothetical protein GY737_01605 [Desulfobacteraceae bacterium]|nr:hypothetical protein [Desulfobacteraceae bacterium]
MKILLPAVEVGENDGFSDKTDIFRRKGFGERLANLIENANDNPVIALDAGWGEGKSTFINMWRGYIQHQRDPKLKTIYFDAFENDYQKDPFLTLASEMYQMLSDEKEEEKTEFRKKASKAVKSLTRGTLKIGVKALTAGIVDGSCVDSLEKDLSSLAANQVDEIIKDKFKNAEKDKLALTEFKTYLEAFANKTGEGKPIIFIVDELDRCRPDFSLELLEKIKHLFSVKGITFLLVTNRDQLEESIKARYGKDIDPTNYLHKFVNLWITLPRKNNEHYDSGIEFLNYAASSMTETEECITDQKAINTISEIVKFYQPSFREIERILTYFSIIHNMSRGRQSLENYQSIMALICYLKACKPNVIDAINKGKDPKEIIALAELPINKPNRFLHLYDITNIIRYDLSSQTVKDEMIQNNEIQTDHFGRMQNDIIHDVINWLSEIDNN